MAFLYISQRKDDTLGKETYLGYRIQIDQTQVVLDHEACAVEIQVEIPELVGVQIDESWGTPVYEKFTGVSKCTPPDDFDADFGYELAYWRAIERAAAKNLRRLNGLIKHLDDVAKEAERIKLSHTDTMPLESIEMWRIEDFYVKNEDKKEKKNKSKK